MKIRTNDILPTKNASKQASICCVIVVIEIFVYSFLWPCTYMKALTLAYLLRNDTCNSLFVHAVACTQVVVYTSSYILTKCIYACTYLPNQFPTNLALKAITKQQ